MSTPRTAVNFYNLDRLSPFIILYRVVSRGWVGVAFGYTLLPVVVVATLVLLRLPVDIKKQAIRLGPLNFPGLFFIKAQDETCTGVFDRE